MHNFLAFLLVFVWGKAKKKTFFRLLTIILVLIWKKNEFYLPPQVVLVKLNKFKIIHKNRKMFDGRICFNLGSKVNLTEGVLHVHEDFQTVLAFNFVLVSHTKNQYELWILKKSKFANCLSSILTNIWQKAKLSISEFQIPPHLAYNIIQPL